MNDYLKKLLQFYRNKGVLIDTNLLLLYLVGTLNIELIREYKRTSHYTTDDFDRVSDFLKLFGKKVVTPHILTEVSDFIDNRQKLQNLLKIFIEKEGEEQFSESRLVVKRNEFIKFGLADTATIQTAKDKYLIFTDDNPLYGFLLNSGIDAISLDQLRKL